MAGMCSTSGPFVLRVLSGGALGADYEWLVAFAERNTAIHTTIYTFDRHTPKIPRTTLVSLKSARSVDDIDDAQKACKHAAAFLKKRFNILNIYTSHLLMRNFLLARDATCILAVGKLDRERLDPSGFCGVQGGTGWTCQLFHDICVKDGKEGPIPMYIYELEENAWMQCSLPIQVGGVGNKISTWTQIDFAASIGPVVRDESSRIGVIGTRDLSPAGVMAIKRAVGVISTLIEK